MAQQDFDNFKQRLKGWMNTHPDEYDLFEAEMNSRDAVGYQKIISKAITFVPQYKKLLLKKANQGMFDEISDIENLFANNKLAQALLNELENANKDTFIPAMLSWLYFGQSFERMVEIGEELRKNPDTGYLQKFAIVSTIRILIFKSISLGLRTKADWEDHRTLMEMVDSDRTIDWAMDTEKKKAGRKKSGKTLSNMMLGTPVNKPEDIIDRIGKYLTDKNSKQDIAKLKVALEELFYIIPCEITAFRNALHLQYGRHIHIISERGIQDAEKYLKTFVAGKGKMIKDFPENRNNLDEIKIFLSC
ncbi:MAG: DUF6043 family protein [Tannerella sp.]|jgi:hypothetical protein|nr:DUF6043 family protein [Tannerella sp.]